MKKHSILLVLLSMVFALATTSCNDYLDVNKNGDAPDNVEAHLYLSGIQQAYQGCYWDIRALGPLTQMMGTSSYTSFANHYYSEASDAAGEAWRMVYWTQGMNLENLINQSLENENWTMAGIGYAMKAYSWDFLTKVNGEVILTDAFVPNQLTHAYNYQDEVYEQVRQWAKTAIELLQREDKTNYSTKISGNDWIYGGDKEKWIKFAYTVIARNLASLSNKKDFKSKYYADFKDAVSKGFSSPDDDAALKVWGGSADAAESGYNNFWGPYRGNLSNVYWQHDYAVQVMTGTVPEYDADGNKTTVENPSHADYPYELAAQQIVCDTTRDAGHFDPRALVKLATEAGNDVASTDEEAALRDFTFRGSGFTAAGGPIATAPNFWGRREAATSAKDGAGRWLYRDDAPYILMTYGELMFDLAEIEFKHGSKGDALSAFKKAVAADMDFTERYMVAGSLNEVSKTMYHAGDKLKKETFRKIAHKYLDGPYVGGLTAGTLTLSHIMMQKFVHLFPWGASEAWVDQRKYFYDVEYTGDYPGTGNGWDLLSVKQKRDDDASKVFKGFYLAPAQVQGRRSAYVKQNNGSPCFRIRPRYNSEYMWNKPSLEKLRPISGMADNYQCSIPWFAYPGDMPK